MCIIYVFCCAQNKVNLYRCLAFERKWVILSGFSDGNKSEAS